MFPGVKVPTDDYGDLMVAIKSEIADRGLQENDKMCSKIIQLHDMVKIRFGVTIVGPTGGGKYSKRRRCNVAVIIVRVIFISSFPFYCLLYNHSFQTNPNRITNCFKLFSLLQLYNYIAPASLFDF